MRLPQGNDPLQILTDGPKAQKVLEMCIKRYEDMFTVRIDDCRHAYMLDTQSHKLIPLSQRKVSTAAAGPDNAKLAKFEKALKLGTIKLARSLVEEQKKMLQEEEADGEGDGTCTYVA